MKFRLLRALREKALYLASLGLLFIYSGCSLSSTPENILEPLKLSTSAILFDRAGKKLPNSAAYSPEVNWSLVKAESAGILKNVVQLYPTRCTGALLNVDGKDDSPAYVLSAGHCVRKDPTAILVNKKSPQTAVFLNYFFDTNLKRYVGITQVAYATMNGTDIALFELNESYQALKKEGYSGFRLSRTGANAGEALVLAGIPETNMSFAQRYVHEVKCTANGKANVHEIMQNGGNLHYDWEDTLLQDCSMVGGISGGPILLEKSDVIVAIANAGANYEVNEKYLDEVTEQYETANRGADVTRLSTCFDSNGRFDIDLPHCRLEKPCQDGEEDLTCQRRVCAEGDARGCRKAAQLLLDLNSEKPSVPDLKTQDEGLRLLEKGCQLHDGPACGALARYWIKYEKVIPIAVEACKLGESQFCGYAGYFHEQGFEGTPPSTESAIEDFERGCLMAEGYSCYRLGETLLADPATALRGAQLFAKGCIEGNSGLCCRSLAQLHESGTVVKKNASLRYNLLHRACDLKDAESCMAINRLSDACNLDGSEGCFQLGESAFSKDLQSLEGYVENLREAKDAFQKACTKGYASGCQRLRTIDRIEHEFHPAIMKSIDFTAVFLTCYNQNPDNSGDAKKCYQTRINEAFDKLVESGFSDLITGTVLTIERKRFQEMSSYDFVYSSMRGEVVRVFGSEAEPWTTAAFTLWKNCRDFFSGHNDMPPAGTDPVSKRLMGTQLEPTIPPIRSCALSQVHTVLDQAIRDYVSGIADAVRFQASANARTFAVMMDLEDNKKFRTALDSLIDEDWQAELNTLKRGEKAFLTKLDEFLFSSSDWFIKAYDPITGTLDRLAAVSNCKARSGEKAQEFFDVVLPAFRSRFQDSASRWRDDQIAFECRYRVLDSTWAASIRLEQDKSTWDRLYKTLDEVMRRQEDQALALCHAQCLKLFDRWCLKSVQFRCMDRKWDDVERAAIHEWIGSNPDGAKYEVTLQKNGLSHVKQHEKDRKAALKSRIKRSSAPVH